MGKPSHDLPVSASFKADGGSDPSIFPIFVTDLDASLLEEDYTWSQAAEALQVLRGKGLPLVLNSSKTVEEMRRLASDLEMNPYLVAENGGVIAEPDASGGYKLRLMGSSRQSLLRSAHLLRAEHGFRFAGFADWPVEEIARRTGLSKKDAERAQARQATEPIDWQDNNDRLSHFRELLDGAGIRLVRGGRFHHLMGEADKADGLRAVAEIFAQRWPGQRVRTIALGDSENDLAMLEAADIAVVIPHPQGPRIEPRARRVIVAPAPASRGWNAAVLALLEEFATN
jgi:mannosyl-3-phosphoglycerate phosphatase